MYVSLFFVNFVIYVIKPDIMRRLLFLCLMFFVMGGCAESERPDPATDASDFGMILRLWPAHHNDEQLRDDLIDALNKYSGTFNEVWFDQHLVLSSPHPSPLSAHQGFFGNHHFSTANSYLALHGKSEIEW